MASAQPIPYRRVYVWEFPVRLYHWVNAACVVALGVTGYLIGNPLAISYSSEAYQQYWFGWVRFIHSIRVSPALFTSTTRMGSTSIRCSSTKELRSS